MIEGLYTDRNGQPLEWESIMPNHPKGTIEDLLGDTLVETVVIHFKNGASCTYRRKK